VAVNFCAHYVPILPKEQELSANEMPAPLDPVPSGFRPLWIPSPLDPVPYEDFLSPSWPTGTLGA
jgi:hypothetical protein